MKESPMNDMRRVHAEQLMSSLELSLPPVAIAFCDVVPDDVPMFEGVVPAGCAFWPQATARTFATAARDHRPVRDWHPHAQSLGRGGLAAG